MALSTVRSLLEDQNEAYKIICFGPPRYPTMKSKFPFLATASFVASVGHACWWFAKGTLILLGIAVHEGNITQLMIGGILLQLALTTLFGLFAKRQLSIKLQVTGLVLILVVTAIAVREMRSLLADMTYKPF